MMPLVVVATVQIGCAIAREATSSATVSGMS